MEKEKGERRGRGIEEKRQIREGGEKKVKSKPEAAAKSDSRWEG